MRQRHMFGRPFSVDLSGRRIPVRQAFMGVPQDLPPTCGANERLTIKVENAQEKWACEPLAGGAPPAGQQGIVDCKPGFKPSPVWQQNGQGPACIPDVAPVEPPAQNPAQNPQGPPPNIPGCPILTVAEWDAAYAQMQAEWTEAGGSTIESLCAVVTFPNGTWEGRQQCLFPGGATGGQSGAIFPSNVAPQSCEEQFATLCTVTTPENPWYQYCPGHGAPAPAPAPSPAPAPAPAPSPSPAPPQGGPIPIGPPIIVYIPPPTQNPSPCDAGAWLRKHPVALGQVRLRRGAF